MIHQIPKNKSSPETTVDGKAMYLVTAGGKIKCLRCTARSTRKKQQCGKPALKTSTTQKCQTHGGRPHTPEVLRRISEANTTHGESTKAAKEQYRQDAVHILQLEDAMRVLKMGEGPSIRGRKPAGYRGVYSEADVVRAITEMLLHRM
jgi:hypothetical protein